MKNSILGNTYNIGLRRYSMKTTRNTSSGNGGAGGWQRGKRAWYAPSGIVLLLMLLLSVIDVGKTYGQQGVGISENPIVPNSSSILELQSTLRGFLAPRMTTVERTAIVSPAQGLLVFDTTTQSFWYYNSGWKAIASTSIGSANQLLGMNSGIPSLANEYKNLNGSSNITVTHTAGNIGLNTIQDIQTISSPTFNGLSINDAATQTNILNNTINLGNASTDVIDITGVTNINGGNLTLASPLTEITGATLNVSDGTTTNINSNTLNIGNNNTDVVDITGITNLNGGAVTIASNLTLATGATVNNIRTDVRATGSTDNVSLVTETGIRTAINSSVTANNGLNEDPDGNIQLGGNLLENTTITNNGFYLVIDGSNGDFAVAPTGNTSVSGTATLTTGTGQVTLGGNLDATNGVDITGAPLTVSTAADLNSTLDVSGQTDLAAPTVATNVRGTLNVAEQATFTGNVDANNGIDVLNGDLNVTDNLNVTTNATITGDALVDGNFRLDAAGQPVNNIRTDVRATGLTDNVSLVTETGIRTAINSSVTADNGLNEDPDGNIQLGGDLLENTTITSNGFNLMIDGSNGDLAVAPTGNTSVTGTATLTTGTGQVTLGGNVDAADGIDVTNGDVNIADNLNVTGNTDVSGTLNADGQTDLAATTVATNVRGTLNVAEQATFTGNVDANNGIDVLNGDLNVTDNLNVTTNATITGDALVDGNFRLDAAGQPVNNIRTDVRATGLTDNVSLVTETGIRTAINSSVTANNGVRENPDGNIQLGGDLTIPTDIGVEAGTALTISDAAEVAAFQVNDAGAITIGNGTVTTGTGQVTLGGNVDAINGVDITGAPLTVATAADLNSTLDVAGQTDLAAPAVATNVRGTLNVSQQATLTGNVDANSGVDVTGNITATGTVDGRDVSVDGGNQDNLQTLTGVGAGSTNLGTFTGSIISDSSTVKSALQDLGDRSRMHRPMIRQQPRYRFPLVAI
ncbi:MAG: hypothetical protein IPN68_00055 [Bacteroidetes bacterium]|nr:hypothetical protein [Bacteroidota bacterium]